MRRRFPVLAPILILAGVAGLAWLSGGPGMMMGGLGAPPGMPGVGMMGGAPPGVSGKRAFSSKGEQIYYTGSSRTTGPIPRTGGPPWTQHAGVGCVACHGVHGRGGVPVMMGSAIPEDIRFEALTGAEQGAQERGAAQAHGGEHPPYTEALLRRAITRGVDPAGKALDWTMPRWRMPEADLDDLLAYLKALR